MKLKIWFKNHFKYNNKNLFINNKHMFLNSLYDSSKDFQTWFQWKSTIAELLAINTSTIEWRFKLLLKIITMWNSLQIKSVKDWNIAIPDLQKIKRILIQSNQMSHSILVMWSNLKIIAQELSFEIIEATNWKWDFSIITDILNQKKKISDFLNIKESVTIFNKVFSFTGKSWKVFKWKWVQDLMPLNTENLKDIITWMNISDEIREILLDADTMKKEFKNHRNWMMWFLKYSIDNESWKWKVMEFIENKLWTSIQKPKEEILTSDSLDSKLEF